MGNGTVKTLATFPRGERAALALEFRPGTVKGQEAHVLYLTRYVDGVARSGVLLSKNELRPPAAALARLADLASGGGQ